MRSSATANVAESGRATIMQGQHSYLQVSGVNGSQTPGEWQDVQVVVSGLPDGVTVEPYAVARNPKEADTVASASGSLAPATNPIPWTKKNIQKIITCAPVAGGTATCRFTNGQETHDAMADPALKKDDVNRKLWTNGAYSVMFKVNVAQNTAPTSAAPTSNDQDGSEHAIDPTTGKKPTGVPINLTASFQYPSYLKGAPTLGAGDSETAKAELDVIAQSDAILGMTTQHRDANSSSWQTFSGEPVRIVVTPEQTVTDPASAVSLRYKMTNDGQRWIRAGDKVVMKATLPAGVIPLTDSAVTDYSGSHEKQLAGFDEKWKCERAEVVQKESNVGSVPLKWDEYTVTCSATVAPESKRTDGWTAPTDKAIGDFPGLILPLRAEIESPSDLIAATSNVSVWRPLTPGQTPPPEVKDGYANISLADNPNAQTKIDIVTVDPESVAPKVEAYWVVRPSAGGHATARIDVANIGRGAARNMNLVVQLSDGATLNSQLTKGGADGAASPNWTCQTIAGVGRVACRYTGELPANQKGSDQAKAPRTAPLYLTVNVPNDASTDPNNPLKIMARAAVVNLSPATKLGEESALISHQVGRPFELAAISKAGDGPANAYDLPVADPNRPVDFQKPITGPQATRPWIKLEASGARGPFEGQPYPIVWKQISGPTVELKPNANVPNPAFIPANSDGVVEYRFSATISDRIEDVSKIPPRVQAVTQYTPQANSRTEEVVVKVGDPASASPSPSPTESVDKQAGGVEKGDAVVKPPIASESASASAKAPQKPPTPQSEPKSATAKAIDLCKKYFANAQRADLAFLKGSVEATASGCSVKNADVLVQGWLEATDVTVELSTESVVLESGKVTLPKQWGSTELKIEKPISIDLSKSKSDNDAKITGALSGKGLPFADQLGNGFADAAIGVALTGTTSTLSVMKPGQAGELLKGSIEQGGYFSLAVNVPDAVDLGSLGKATLTGSITNLKPTAEKQVKALEKLTASQRLAKATYVYDVQGTLADARLNDSVTIPTLTIKATSSGDYAVSGEAQVAVPDQDPLVVAANGAVSKGIVTLSGKTEMPGWSFLPGAKFTVSAKDLVYDTKKGKLQSGKVDAQAATDVLLGSSPVSIAAGSDVTVNLETGAVRFDGAVVVNGPDGPARITGSGSYADEGDGSKLNVTFEQKASDPALKLGGGSQASGMKVVVDRVSQQGQPGDFSTQLAAKNINVANFVTFNNADIAATKDSLAIKQGTAVGLPPDWGITDLNITKDIVIPLSGSGKPTGEIEGKGVPFVADQDVAFTVSLSDSGTNTVKASGSGVDFSGTVTAAGAYDLNGSVDTGSVKTKIACAAPDIKKADWAKCTGSVHFGPISAGPLQIDEVGLAKDSSGNYPVTVDARVNMEGQQPTAIKLTGVYRKNGNVQTVTADASGSFDWSFLPGTFTAGGKGLTFENTGTGWNLKTGTLALSTQNANVVPGLFALPSAVVALDLATKQFAAQGAVAAAGKPVGSISYDSAAKKLALNIKQGAEPIAVDGVGSLAGLDGTVDVTWPDNRATVGGRLNGGTVSIDNVFVVDAKSISFENSGVTLGSGTSVSTPDWGINATVPDGQTVEIRSDQGQTSVKGALRADGLPFANKLPFGGVSDVSTEVSFGSDPTTVKVMKANVEAPLMQGTIAADGAMSVALALKDGGEVNVPGFGVVSLSGKVDRAPGPKQPITVSGVSGRVDQLSLADGLVSGALGLKVADGSGAVNLDGSVAVNIPGQDPIVVAVVDGKYDSAAKLVTAREVTATGIKIPGLGGETSFAVSSSALSLPLDKSAKATGEVTVKTAALPIVPGTFEAQEAALTLNLATRDASFAGQVLAGGLPLAATGSYTTDGEGTSTLKLETTQASGDVASLVGGNVDISKLVVNARRSWNKSSPEKGMGWSGSLAGDVTVLDALGATVSAQKPLTFDDRAITVPDGTTVSLPDALGVSGLTVVEPVVVPVAGQSGFAGKVSGRGLPFASALGVDPSKYEFTVGVAQDGTQTLTATGQDLNFSGSISAAKVITLDAKVGPATVKCSEPLAKPDWSKCSAGLSFGPVDAGPLQVKAAVLERDGSEGKYKVSTTGEIVTGEVRSPISIGGVYDEATKTATLNASGEMPGGDLLPGATFVVAGEKLMFTKTGQGWSPTSGVVTAKVKGDVALVPGMIAAADPSVTVTVADRKLVAAGGVKVGGSKIGDLSYDGAASPAKLAVTLNQDESAAVLPGGITATGLKGQLTRTLGADRATTMKLTAGALDISGVANVSTAGVTYDGSKITVGKDTKLTANPAWGLPELTAASDIVITPQTTGTQVTGAITANGLPFAATLPVAGATDIATTVTFATAQPTTVAVKKTTVDKPLLAGDINPDGSFALALNATNTNGIDNTIPINGFGTVSLAAKVARQAGQSVVVSDVSGGFSGVSVADGLLSSDEITLAQAKAGDPVTFGGNVSIAVPGQDPLTAGIRNGTYDGASRKVTFDEVAAKGVSLGSLAPGASVDVTGKKLVIDLAAGGKTTGQVAVTTKSLTLVPEVAAVNNMTLDINLDTRDIKFDGQVLAGGLPLAATGSYVTKDGSSTFEVNTTQGGEKPAVLAGGAVTMTGLGVTAKRVFGANATGWSGTLAGVADVQNLVKVDAKQINFDQSGIVVGQGTKVSLPTDWQMPEFSVTKDVKVPATAQGQFSGQISAVGVPFADVLGLGESAKDYTFEVTWNPDKSKSLSVSGPESGLKFNGTISATNQYTIDASYSAAKINCSGDVAKPDWSKCSAGLSFGPVDAGPLQVKAAVLERDGSEGKYKVSTTGEIVTGEVRSPISIGGVYDEATKTATLNASGEMPGGDLLPGATFVVAGEKLMFTKTGQGWSPTSGVVTAKVKGDVALVPGMIAAADPSVTVTVADRKLVAAGGVKVGGSKIGDLSYDGAASPAKLAVTLNQDESAAVLPGGITATGLKGQLTRTLGADRATTMKLTAGALDISGVANVSTAGVTYDGSKITVGKDTKLTANPAWGLPELTAASDIVITPQTTGTQVTGAITANGLPFAATLPVAGATDIATTVTFATAQPTTVAVKKTTVDKPLLAGDINPDGSFALALNATNTNGIDNTIPINGFGTVSLKADITRGPPAGGKSAPVEFKGLEGALTDASIADGLVKIKELRVAATDASGKTLEVKGNGELNVPDQATAAVSLEGTYESQKLSLARVEASNVSLPTLLPNTQLSVSGKNVVYDFGTKKTQSGDVTLTSGGNTELFPGAVSLANAKVTVGLVTKAISFGADLELPTKSSEPVTQAVTGEYKTSGQDPTTSELSLSLKASSQEASLPGDVTLSGLNGNVVGRFGGANQGWSADLGVGALKITDTFAVTGTKLAFDSTKLTIASGSVALPKDWQMPELSVTSPITIPLGAKPTEKFSGAISGQGFPFAKTLNVEEQTKAAMFTIAFDQDGSRRMSVSGAAGVTFSGAINADQSYKLVGSVEVAPLTAKVSCEGPNVATPDWASCSGSASIDKQKLGPLYIEKVELGKQSGKGQVFEVKVNAQLQISGQEDAPITAIGTWDKSANVIKLDAGGDVKWSFLPGDFKVDGRDIVIEKPGGQWRLASGSLDLTTNADLVPGVLRAENAKVSIDLATSEVTASGDVVVGASKVGGISYSRNGGRDSNGIVTVVLDQQSDAALGAVTAKGLKGEVFVEWEGTGSQKTRVVRGELKSGTIGLESVVSVSASGVTFNGEGVTIGSNSEIAFNEEWGLPAAKASGDGVKIRGTSAKPEVSGEVTVVGIPFAKNLGVGEQAADVNTKISFGGSKTSVKVSKGADPALIDGTVSNGVYTLAVNMRDAVDIPGFGRGSANGTITNADVEDVTKKSATRFVVNLEFVNIKLGDQVVIQSLKGDANSAGVYNLAGTAALGGETSPQIIKINADIDPANINFTGTTDLPEWSQLPGMKLKAIVNFKLDRAAKAYSGDIGLAGQGSMSYAQDKVKLTSPSVKYAFNQSGGITVKAGGDLEIASMVPSAAPLKMPAAGTVDLSGKAASFKLTAEQVKNETFTLADGVAIKSTKLEFSYNPNPSTEEGQAAPEKFAARFSSDADITIPMPSGDQTASTTVQAKYSSAGLEFDGRWNTDKWELGQGVDLTNLQIGYRSSFGKSESLPDLGEFNGLAVSAKMNPGDGSFLADTVGMKGEHNAIARIDPATKTFDVAVVSQGTVDLANGEGYKVQIARPYIKAAYASAGGTAPKRLTVALGGTGTFEYKDPATGAQQKLENLAFGAAYDSAARTITGNLKIKNWLNAAGIQGLTVSEGSIDVSSVPDPASQTRRVLSASFFALVDGKDSKPAFLTRMGIDKSAPIALGVGFGKSVCSMLTIGSDSPSAEVALRPFSFVGDGFGDVLQVRYAAFITATGPCRVGSHEFTGSAMQIRGNLLGQLPLETDMAATQAPGGGKVELASTKDSGKIESASLGAATVDNAQVGIALDTDKPQAFSASEAAKPNPEPVSKESPGVSFAGSLPLGKQKLDLAGRAAFADGQVKLKLGAKSDELAFGSFKVKKPVVDAGVSFDIKKRQFGDDFSLKASGAAEMLGTTANVGIDMAYAGGTVSSFTGSVGVPKGLKVGNKVVVRGDGKIGWTSTSGLSVNIGSTDPAASPASVEVCTDGARDVMNGADKVGAECTSKASVGVTNAYLTVKPGGFSAAGNLNLGKTLTARVNGAYWTAPDGKTDSVEFAGKQYVAKAGDYSFGVNDAKITMPTGQVSASAAVAKFTRGSEEIDGARIGFETPVMNGRIGFDGTIDSGGTFTAVGTAQNISLGGFKIDNGKATVSNVGGAVAVKLDLTAKLLGTTDIKFLGEYRESKGSVGVRMRGDLNIKFASGAEGSGSATYSNFPEDAGFGLGFKMKIVGGTEVEFDGVLRKVNSETLYRVKGAVAVPVSPGVTAGGMVQLDNCVDTDGYACTVARKINNETTPLLTIGASAKVGGGLIEISVKGDARFDGAFRLVGEGKAGRHFGPYDFGIGSAEAGFNMLISACMANDKATRPAGDAELMGCGQSKSQTWEATLNGSAWIKGTVGRGWFSKSGQIDVNVRGRMGPTESKYCANGSFIGISVSFGECPT